MHHELRRAAADVARLQKKARKGELETLSGVQLNVTLLNGIMTTINTLVITFF